MKIAIFNRSFNPEVNKVLREIIDILDKLRIDYLINLENRDKFDQSYLKGKEFFFFKTRTDILNSNVDFFVSVGGDGTFLDTLLFVLDTQIPVMGINTGRLGFLANTQIEEMEQSFNRLKNNDFQIEARTVLELESDPLIFNKANFALNDFTIHKRDNSSMTSITTFLNGEFFNTYWGDGIIVSTPSGSTAYSLSCGGPIVFPESNTFVITPVAPHNLTVRPVIVSDNVEISFEINQCDKNYLVSLDSRYKIIGSSHKICIRKANFHFKTVKFQEKSFSKILREKLNWGIDKRNI